jgi:hypothetical protein
MLRESSNASAGRNASTSVNRVSWSADEGARASKTAINGETWRFSKQDFMP